MQDAVILANCLYDMASIYPQNITAAFTDYHNQRHEHVVSQYEISKMNAKLMYGQVGISCGSNHIVPPQHHSQAYLPRYLRYLDMVRKASSLCRLQPFAQNVYGERIAQGRCISTPSDIHASNPWPRARPFFTTETIQAIHRRATGNATRYYLKLFGCDRSRAKPYLCLSHDGERTIA